MASTRLVVIEDEQAIRRGISDALRASGYEIAEASDGVRGLDEAARAGVDLVLLDLMLPRRDGLDVLTQLRRLRPSLPVIILTARGSEDDRVRGLRMGADDYVVKPFSARELLARVEAVLRRAKPKLVNGIAAKDLVGPWPPTDEGFYTARLGRAIIDLRRREVAWGGGQRGELSETESAILLFLLSHRQRAVSREELLTYIWGLEPDGLETRTIDMHVARLRMKLRDPSGRKTPEAILTVRNHGYMAAPDLIPANDHAPAEAERKA
ncbi:MAG: response regulator transcription factor [Planctomycetes bacterium]|nr:response regulator transcription factor [Planctomycetota bacterium]